MGKITKESARRFFSKPSSYALLFALVVGASAYNRDPEFYAFWKIMESYANTLTNRDATYSTNMDYFRYLYSPEGRR